MPDPVAALRIGNPEVALAVEIRSMRPDEQAGAERLEELATAVVFQDRWLAAPGARVLVTSMYDIDAAVGRLLDRSDGGPFRSRRKLAPIPCRAVGLRQVIAGSV